MDAWIRNNVVVEGNPDGPTIVFAHGLGGTQAHWAPIIAALAPHARCVTFALAGSPGADPSAFGASRHSTLFGFADDLAEICADLDTEDLSYVGHSVSGAIGMVAAAADPTLFRRLVVINASPRYVDDPSTGYVGGFTQEQVDGVLAAIATDFTSWTAGFGPLMMGNPDRPGFADEFTRTLGEYRPDVASVIFRATFTADIRDVIGRVTAPTLVLQSREDPAVPFAVAEWLTATLANATVRELDSAGHFPQVVAPEEIASAIGAFLLAAAP